MPTNHFQYSKILDISPTLSSSIAVFPGDTTFSRVQDLSINSQNRYSLSHINCSLHTGAHADAPNHYSEQGQGIQSRDLEPYIGPCQVIQVAKKSNERIKPSDLKTSITEPRVLFKTLSFPNPNHWNNDFMALSPELIEYLAKQQVKLVGIDTPSVDLANDKKLISHQCISEHDLSILEGIVLESILPGRYFLLAAPLKIDQADAGLVRAVLLQ